MNIKNDIVKPIARRLAGLCACAMLSVIAATTANAAVITATPQTFTLASGAVGTATITWNANPYTWVSLTLSVDGAAETGYAGGGATGTASAPWITAPHRFVFRMYPALPPDGHPDTSNLLASTTVDAVLAPSAAPGAVGSVTVPTTNSTGTFDIQWTHPTTGGAVANYEVDERRAENPATPFVLSANPYGTDTMMSVAMRPVGQYQFRVRACNVVGCGPYVVSNICTVGPPVTGVPQAPVSIAVPLNNYTGTFAVSWVPSSSGPAATYYRLKQSLYGQAPYVIAESIAATSTDVTVGTSANYYHRVAACNANGCSADTASTYTAVQLPDPGPQAPITLFTPTTNTSGTFVVSWTPSASGPPATYFKLDQRRGSGSWLAVNDHATATSNTITVGASDTYYYRVAACDSSYCSTFVESSGTVVTLATAVPDVPATITVPAANATGSFTVAWTAASSGPVPTYYRLSQRIASAAWTDVDTHVTGNSKIVTVGASGTYYYAVAACNAAGCSATKESSAVAVALPVPPTPVSISAPATSSSGNFTVSWVAGAGTAATYYKLEQRQDSGGWISLDANVAGLSKAITVAVSGTYFYRVAACNAVGCSSSIESSGTNVTIPTPVPNAPTTVSVPGTNTSGSFSVSWTPNSTGPVATYFRLDRRLGSGAWAVLEPNLSGTSRTVSVPASGTYYHRVAACNAGGCSSATESSATLVTLSGGGTGRETFLFHHTDALGSVVATTDLSGVVVSSNVYRAFGARKPRIGTPIVLGFTGKPHDDELALDNFGARYYDPMYSRFVSIDPADFSASDTQSFNRYAYASNNPGKFLDPNGENIFSVLDWYDFGKDVGGLVVTEIVYVAAAVNGDQAVMNLAAEDMEAGRMDAAISTLGIASPAPGTGRVLKTANRVEHVIEAERTAGRALDAGKSGSVVIGETMSRVEDVASKIPGA